MEALRVDENLDAVNPTPYAWRDILIEEMELSRGEYALLTDRTLTIRELYGFPAGVPAVPANLRQAQYFTRRVGISYEELMVDGHLYVVAEHIVVADLECRDAGLVREQCGLRSPVERWPGRRAVRRFHRDVGTR